MSVSKMRSLVSSTWLKEAIKYNSSLCLLEASWAPHGKGYPLFVEKHIPSAKFFDMWKGVTPSLERPRDVPNPRIFEEYSRENGINSDSHIVIYDRSLSFFSSRLWHTFKLFGHENVSVLNGGLIYWLQQGFPIEAGNHKQLKPGNYRVKEKNTSLLRSYEDMINNASEKNFQVVDCRNPIYYNGEKEEPSRATVDAIKTADLEPPQSMIKGHMPHSFNVENDEFLDPETRCIISEEKLKKLFHTAGVDMTKPITSMCYNGISACLVPLALSNLQQDCDVSVYVGSWTEFGQRATETDVELGDSTSSKPVQGG